MRTKIMASMVAAVVVVMMVAVTGAYAGDFGTGKGKGADPEAMQAARFDRIADKLALSDAQKEQIKKQRADSVAGIKKTREDIRAMRLELKQELEKPAIDNARVNELTAKLKTLVGQQIQSRVDNVLAMKKILTPEQFAKMHSLIEERKKGFEDRMGKRFGNRQSKEYGQKGGPHMDRHNEPPPPHPDTEEEI